MLTALLGGFFMFAKKVISGKGKQGKSHSKIRKKSPHSWVSKQFMHRGVNSAEK